MVARNLVVAQAQEAGGVVVQDGALLVGVQEWGLVDRGDVPLDGLRPNVLIGPDNIAFAYVGELEVYERAGIPTPAVLRIATLVPAQVMDEADDYGSIEAGKVADIIIVDGNPAARIADLRRIETVVRGGRVYSIRDLYAEVGVTPNR